jgi:hypothetical protein
LTKHYCDHYCEIEHHSYNAIGSYNIFTQI